MDGAYETGLHPKTLQPMFSRWRQCLARYQLRRNDTARIGGWDDERDLPVEVEIDEVCLRIQGFVDDDGKEMVRAVRYCGLVRRGSSKIILVELPDAEVEAGGGGPISNAELYEKVMVMGRGPAGEPIFRALDRTLFHTDSAKACANLGWTESALPS